MNTDVRLFLIAEEGCAEGDEGEELCQLSILVAPSRREYRLGVLNWVSNASIFLLHLERRFDHWLRPPFDAVLRDPIARLTTALINMQRPNEGLKIAEEKPMPDGRMYCELSKLRHTMPTRSSSTSR